MLTFQFYTPGPEVTPSREETFRRIHRFEAHCRKLGIPNPYSYDQHVKADERWRRLHEHAVPPLLDFMAGEKYIDENFAIKNIAYAKNTRVKDDDFNF
jgi:hypothetical protein